MVREIIVSRFMTNSQSNPTGYIIGFNLKISENYINYIQKNISFEETDGKTIQEIIDICLNSLQTDINNLFDEMEMQNIIGTNVTNNLPTTYPNWVQPQGTHDCYAINAIVTHNNKNWKNTIACNVWEPGIYG